jgi:hypothetical protein
MLDFAGFEDWVEIFRGGKQTDSQGREHDGDELLRIAVKTFNPQHHEPPLVLGHPALDAPAFGWVEGLKVVGNTLYAKFKDVSDEIEELIKKGLYKKRSASFYPDGRLRHVGFLGAAVPSIKGLSDMAFMGNEEFTSFELADTENAGEILQRKTIEILNNPPKFNHRGQEIGENFSYSDALNFAMAEDPELAEEYMQSIKPNR